MPFSRGDYGDDKPPHRPARTNHPPIRKTLTEETEKQGNSAASRSRRNLYNDATSSLPRKPMRGNGTDQPLAAPRRISHDHAGIPTRQCNLGFEESPPRATIQSSSKETAWRGTAGVSRYRQQETDDPMIAQPTIFTRSESGESHVRRRERVVASTVFLDDNSYEEDQIQKGSFRRTATRNQAVDQNWMVAKTAHRNEEYKQSLQQEQTRPLVAKYTSTCDVESPDNFVDEYDPVDEFCNSTVRTTTTTTPRPPSQPTRQSNILQSLPGAYQGQPGEGFRRNASNWKEPFLATQTSSYTDLPSYPDLGDRMPRRVSLSDPKEELVQASPVMNEEPPPDPSQLEVAKPEDEIQQRKQRQKLIWVVGVLIVFFTIATMALVAGLIVRSQRKDHSPKIIYSLRGPTPRPTDSPTAAPTAILMEGLPRETLERIQDDPNSPQARAYSWYANGPYRLNYGSPRARQRLALATLYFATKGNTWKHADYWLDYESNECTWFASNPNATIGCDEQSYLLRLELFNNTLNGTIPPEIGLLTTLQVLDLADNALQGTLPSELGLLANLKNLSVSNNFMGGSLPTELGLLSQLGTVYIQDNNFDGSLPSELGHMTGMEDWFMSRTRIGGTIPTEIGNWRNLKSFRTWNTDLKGTLPTEMGLWTSLTYLAMHNGVLEGTIPTEFGRLAALNYLQLDVHYLSGTIPSELGQLKEISFLSFGGNQLASTLPSQLGQLPKLQGLRFYQNKLTGSLPTELGNLGFLQRLELDDNQIRGRIPSEISNAPFLTNLYLGNNQLSGLLPPQLGDLEYLEHMILKNNPKLGGSIPDEWGGLASQGLKELFLNGAAISGSIPAALCAIDRFSIDCNQDICGCNCQACL